MTAPRTDLSRMIGTPTAAPTCRECGHTPPDHRDDCAITGVFDEVVRILRAGMLLKTSIPYYATETGGPFAKEIAPSADTHLRISILGIGGQDVVEINGRMFHPVKADEMCVGTVAEAELAALRRVAEAARSLSRAAEGHGLRKCADESDWDRLDEALAALPKETT